MVNIHCRFMFFLGEFGGFGLDSEICKKHFRSTSDIVNIIDNMCQYGLANGPQKSRWQLWQFVILYLSSFGMIITEPSGLLYLALYERNLHTSWNAKVSNHVFAQCLCVCVFGHSMGFFSSTTSSLFGKSFLQYLGIWSVEMYGTYRRSKFHPRILLLGGVNRSFF